MSSGTSPTSATRTLSTTAHLVSTWFRAFLALFPGQTPWALLTFNHRPRARAFPTRQTPRDRRSLGESFGLSVGYLCAKVDPPVDGEHEYYELNDVDDTGDDDSRWEDIMKMFEVDSHQRSKKVFVLEYVS